MIIITIIAPEGVQTVLQDVRRTLPSARITSLTPTVLADTRCNEFPTWRKSLLHILHTGVSIVINVITYTTPDSITDFVRSVRALNSGASPYVFTTDPVLFDTCLYVNGMYTISGITEFLDSQQAGEGVPVSRRCE
jgi:hypothetical protein